MSLNAGTFGALVNVKNIEGACINIIFVMSNKKQLISIDGVRSICVLSIGPGCGPGLPGAGWLWTRIRQNMRGWAGLGWAGLGWAGLGWAGLGWAGLGWAGLGWAGLGWAGLGWAGLGWAGLGWAGLGWAGLGWAGLGWAGLGWAGLGWAGLGWAGLGWAGLGWAGLDWADLLIRKNLRWTGHFMGMSPDRLPKQVLYSLLSSGHRKRGRHRLRFKNTIKRNLKLRDIKIDSWTSLSQQRDARRATVK